MAQPQDVTIFLDLEEIHIFIYVFKDLLSIYCVPGTRVGVRDRDESLARKASRPVGKPDINQQFHIIDLYKIPWKDIRPG